MAGNSVTQLFNGNVYFNGDSFAGKIEECNLPDPKFAFSDKKSLSNFAKFQLPTGLDVMSMKVKMNSIDKKVIKLAGNPFNAVDIMVRSTIQNWDGGSKTSEVPLVAYVTGTSKKVPDVGLKQNDNTEQELEFSVTGYRLEIDGEVILDMDVFANKYIVGGVDLLADYRANLGLD